MPLSSKEELDDGRPHRQEASKTWRKVSVIERTRWLYDIRQAFIERVDDIAATITREMGKTYPDAQAEVARSIENIEAACGVPTMMQGKILEGVATAIDCETIRQPVGVVGNIVPFNFPAMVPFWFLPYAIACGNAYMLKPSEQVPMTQALMWEIMDERRRPAAGRHQPRERLRRRRQRDARLARHRRHLVRRLGQDARDIYRRRPRTASACRRSAARRTTWS